VIAETKCHNKCRNKMSVLPIDLLEQKAQDRRKDAGTDNEGTDQVRGYSEGYGWAIAREFAALDQLILICGRYEGIDERAKEIIADREISIGDYVLSGGEIPAMAVADAVIRLIPGVLGNNTSVEHESFENGLLEHPHYTRPEIFRGMKVPEVLLSGNHSEIDKWRHSEALRLTLERRPDMAGRFADPVNDVKNKKCPKPKIETK